MYNLKHWNCLWQILDHKKRIGTDTTHPRSLFVLNLWITFLASPL